MNCKWLVKLSKDIEEWKRILLKRFIYNPFKSIETIG